MIRVSEVNWKTRARGQVDLTVVSHDRAGPVSIDITARWTHNEEDGARPQVLWRAAGRVSTTVAREFAQAILKAADIADEECFAAPEDQQS